jgi:ankyrin repeat protein
VVQLLVAAGCRIDVRDTGPLTSDAIDHATENGHAEVLRALISAGADINARHENGMTPLIRYCRSLNVSGDMVLTLVEAGADIHATWFRGRTALHDAVELVSGDRRGRLREVVIALVEAGLDVNVRDESFSTPLHYAVGGEGVDLSAVQALLELGADPSLKNDYGQTPVDLAPKHVRIRKRIVTEDKSAMAGFLTMENLSERARLLEEEKSWRIKALEEAEEVVRLLGLPRRRWR